MWAFPGLLIILYSKHAGNLTSLTRKGIKADCNSEADEQFSDSQRSCQTNILYHTKQSERMEKEKIHSQS